MAPIPTAKGYNHPQVKFHPPRRLFQLIFKCGPRSRARRLTLCQFIGMSIALITLWVLYSVMQIMRKNDILDYSRRSRMLEELYDPLFPVEQNKNSSRILLVSSFFPLAKSKHSLADYSAWLHEFLSPITTDIYFFTPPEMESTIRDLRGDLPIIIDTTYPTPFDVPPLRDMAGKYEEMHAWDRERDIHSPALYAVWNAKPFLLHAAVEKMTERGERYDYAFWNDAGSFRGRHQYRDWPNSRRVDNVWRIGGEIAGKADSEDLMFFPLTGMFDENSKDWTEHDGPVDRDISEGMFLTTSVRLV